MRKKCVFVEKSCIFEKNCVTLHAFLDEKRSKGVSCGYGDVCKTVRRSSNKEPLFLENRTKRASHKVCTVSGMGKDRKKTKI